MIENKRNSKYSILEANLKIDCEKCSGLCCVALYCMKTDGFPANKDAGVPCKNLATDFLCNIHSQLGNKNMRGCLAYDCFGAGQKVTQSCYHNMNWKTNPEKANEIFQVFLMIYQLHQMEWYLLEALSLIAGERLKSNQLYHSYQLYQSEIEALITENERMTNMSPDEIVQLDIDQYRTKVNQVLKQISNIISTDTFDESNGKDYFGKNLKQTNLDGKDFSMAMLIAADLEGCSLYGTNFFGADMRDTNIRNTDLRFSVFLTQMQINATKGNANTKLPENLSYPVSWQGSS